jgi:hypothetical protein
MTDKRPDYDDLPLWEWEKEVSALAQKPAGADIYVLVLWPLGRLYATGFQPLVEQQMPQIPLQRQSSSGLADACISVSLPKPEQAQCEKYTSDTGDVLLTIRHHVVTVQVHTGIWTDVHLSTSRELLRLVDEEAPLLKQ